MNCSVFDLKQGEKGIITEVYTEYIPLKLLEMGCLPGHAVELVQQAPFNGPMYLNVNDTHVSIRKETALHIMIKKIPYEQAN